MISLPQSDTNSAENAISIQTADYMEIIKYVEDEMRALLSNSSHDLQAECMNCVITDTNGDIYNQCKSINRIKIILKAYEKWMNCSQLYKTVSPLKVLTYKNIYTFNEINTDYMHIKQHMNQSEIIRNKVQTELRNELQCIECNYERNPKYDVTETMTVHDTVFKQEFHKIYSYLANSHFDNKQQSRPYLGKKEDEKWWNYTTDDNELEEHIYSQLTKKMGVFRWQSCHGFTGTQHHGTMHLKPKYQNIKEEALYNPFNSISSDSWNQTLRKSTIFFESFARRQIVTLFDERYYDKITQNVMEWRKGENINMQEIVIFKLYTDFDGLQHELKKCFRFDTASDIFTLNNFDTSAKNEFYEPNTKDSRYTLEQRLCVFYWWRSGLLMVLHKYACTMDPNKPLYHGINAKMILNNGGRQRLAFCGPLSTSSSYHVARTFATAKGMVLKLTTQFPRLGLCRTFDASLISDYPEEQEWLISFAYLRILAVYTRPLNADWVSFDNMDTTDDDYKIPMASKTRSIFFAVQLFRHQFYSMSVHLEYWVTAFLYLQCHYNEQDNNHDNGRIKSTKFVESLERIRYKDNDYDRNQDLLRYHQIMNMLWNKFENFRKFPNGKQVVRVGDISENLKPYFMDFADCDIRNKERYIVSFCKILKIFENAMEIHFVNNYVLDNGLLKKLIQYIDGHANHKLKIIKFLYYDVDCTQYQYHPDNLQKNLRQELEKNLRQELEKRGWNIYHKNMVKVGHQILLRSYN